MFPLIVRNAMSTADARLGTLPSAAYGFVGSVSLHDCQYTMNAGVDGEGLGDDVPPPIGVVVDAPPAHAATARIGRSRRSTRMIGSPAPTESISGPRARPAANFIQDNPGGDGGIQRRGRTVERDAHEQVALAAYQRAQALTLRTHDDGEVAVEVGLVQRPCRRRRIRSDDPQARLLQDAERLAHVDDTNDGEALSRARRDFARRRGHAGGAPLRNDDGIGPGAFRSTDDGPEVVRIGHVIEDDEEGGRPTLAQHVVQLRVRERLDERHHALMRLIRKPLEEPRVVEMRRDAALASEREYPPEDVVAAALAKDVHLVHGLAAFDGRRDRVDSVEILALATMRRRPTRDRPPPGGSRGRAVHRAIVQVEPSPVSCTSMPALLSAARKRSEVA